MTAAGGGALPYPPDDPADIRRIAGSLTSCGSFAGEAAAGVRADRDALSAGWSGEAADASGAELAVVAEIASQAADALADGTGALLVYAGALEETRFAIDSLRSAYDDVTARPLTVGDQSPERARDAAEAHQSAFAELHRQHEELLDDADLAAEMAGRRLRVIAERAAPVARGADVGAAVDVSLLERLPLLREHRVATDGRGAAVADDLAEDLRRLLDEYPADGDASWEEIAPLLAVLRQRRNDPIFAAALLNLLGADAYQRIPDLIRAGAFGWSGADAEALFVGGLGALSAVLITASHTLGRPEGLSQRFLDDLTGATPGEAEPGEAETGDGEPSDEDRQIDQVQDALSAAGLAENVAEPVARAAGAGRLAAVLDGTGKLLLVTAVAAPVVDALQGQWDEAAGSTVTAGLAVVGATVSGPVGWAALAFGGLITIVSLVGSQRDSPWRPAAPADENPGWRGYRHYADEAGVPMYPPLRG